MSDILVCDRGDGADIVLRNQGGSLDGLSKTSSEGSVPDGLGGERGWYFSGKYLNQKPVFYHESNAFAQWELHPYGAVISRVEDVGGNPLDFFYLGEVLRVTEAGRLSIRGYYLPTGTANSYFKFTLVGGNGNQFIQVNDVGDVWHIYNKDEDVTELYSSLDSPLPASPDLVTMWEDQEGGLPLPSVTLAEAFIGAGLWEGGYLTPEIEEAHYTDNADLYADEGLGTAVYISLFDAPTWSEVLKRPEERIDGIGQFEGALNLPISVGSIANMQAAASKQLKWLVDQGVCASVRVEVRNTAVGKIEVDIIIREPNSIESRFKLLWDREEQKLTSFIRSPNRSIGREG